MPPYAVMRCSISTGVPLPHRPQDIRGTNVPTLFSPVSERTVRPAVE